MPVQVVCETCGKTFSVPPSTLKYDPPRFCSPACFYVWLEKYERAEYVDVACESCGKPMHILASRYKDGHGRYCSRSCAARGRKPTRSVPKIQRICQHCGKTFEVYPSQAKHDRAAFCSKVCAHQGRVMPKRKKDIRRICQFCGKVFYVAPAVIKRPTRGTFCSARCRGAATAAKIGGISPTSIEQALMAELDSRGIAYTAQYPLLGYAVDIAFPARHLVVEADGTYWHNLPNAQRRDARRDRVMREHGWTVLRFDEQKIRESPAACVDQIVKHLS